jgi:hypothetical protein
MLELRRIVSRCFRMGNAEIAMAVLLYLIHRGEASSLAAADCEYSTFVMWSFRQNQWIEGIGDMDGTSCTSCQESGGTSFQKKLLGTAFDGNYVQAYERQGFRL